MANNYDVIIIGAGPGGIFCAYELMEKRPDLKVLMIEKGRSIEKRNCPKRVTKTCAGCVPCSITTGFAGAGAFSDGKLSLSPDEEAIFLRFLAMMRLRSSYMSRTRSTLSSEQTGMSTESTRKLRSVRSEEKRSMQT